MDAADPTAVPWVPWAVVAAVDQVLGLVALILSLWMKVMTTMDSRGGGTTTGEEEEEEGDQDTGEDLGVLAEGLEVPEVQAMAAGEEDSGGEEEEGDSEGVEVSHSCTCNMPYARTCVIISIFIGIQLLPIIYKQTSKHISLIQAEGAADMEVAVSDTAPVVTVDTGITATTADTRETLSGPAAAAGADSTAHKSWTQMDHQSPRSLYQPPPPLLLLPLSRAARPVSTLLSRGTFW